MNSLENTRHFLEWVSHVLPALVALAVALCFCPASARAATTPDQKNPPAESAAAVGASASAPPAPSHPIFIREYRVLGAKILNQGEIGEAVYPFLGPERTETDVEAARAALEKIYKDKGYQTVSVQVPPQEGKGGVVFLQVIEAPVGRLRVHGSRFYSLDEIKKRAPSMAEGTVPNFNDVTRDILNLNQWPDRRVTPSLRPGFEPDTVDIDLTVKDTPPLHGSIELNNRYSADTTELRLNTSLSYNNLWQLGHSVGASFQVAPEDPSQVKVFSGYYTARLPSVEGLTFTLQGTKQDSNVSTLGGAAVAGRGETAGLRVGMTLSPGKDFYHSLSFGLDYKHYIQGVDLGTGPVNTPITYFPLSVAYNASWIQKNYSTELNAALNFHLRGLGSNEQEFDDNRYRADGGYIYLRGDLTHTHELPLGLEAEAKVQGQISGEPLVNSEQFGGGGLGTVRGYLEAEALGDNAIVGSIELRSPSLLGLWGDKVGDWRVYVFGEGAILTIHDPLPEQDSRFELASIGVGSKLRLLDHLNGSIDAGLPLTSQSHTQSGDVLLTFRVWADF